MPDTTAPLDEFEKEYQAMTPFLDTAFPEFPKQSVTKKEIDDAGQRYVSKFKKFSRQKLLQYLK